MPFCQQLKYRNTMQIFDNQEIPKSTDNNAKPVHVFHPFVKTEIA